MAKVTKSKAPKEIKLKMPKEFKWFLHASLALNSDYGMFSLTLTDSAKQNYFKIVAIDLNTGEQVKEFESSIYYAQFLEISNDSKIIIAGTGEQTLVWDLASGEKLHEFIGKDKSLWLGKFSGDNTKLIGRPSFSESQNNAINLYNTATWEIQRQFFGHLSPVHAVSISPCGKYILSSSCAPELKIILWDAKEAKPIYEFSGYHKTLVYILGFSPDSQKFISCAGTGLDRVIRLWDVATGKEIYCFDFPYSVRAISFSLDSRYIALSAQDSNIYLWDLEKREEVAKFQGHRQTAIKVVFSSSGQELISISLDKTIRRWDIDFAK